MKIIVVANQKGGIGKTSTVTSLASALNLLGHKTLVIDADRQCNTTDTYRAEFEGVATMYDVVLEDEKNRTSLAEAIQHTDAGDIVPADKPLAQADKILYGDLNGLYRFKDALEEIKNGDFDYEYILIDTPNQNDAMLQSALVAADEVIIPTLSDRYSVQGLADVNQTIYAIKKRLNPNLKVAGILLCKVDKRTNLDKEAKESLIKISELMKTNLFETSISTCQDIPNSQKRRMLIHQYDKNSKAAKDYIDLAKELIGENLNNDRV